MWDFAEVLELLILFQGILTLQLRHFSHNVVRMQEFLFFSEFFWSFFQFSYHKDKFLISSKTSKNFEEKYLFKVSA